MKRRGPRIWVWLAMVAGGAALFQTVGFSTNNGAFSGGCREFDVNGVTSAVDMCYLLDCQNGFFGGLVDPCDPQNPALLDCSSTSTTPTTGTTTNTGGMGGG